MGRRWIIKLLTIGGLMLLLLLPMAALRDLVSERQARGMEVAEGIAASSSRAQMLVGPLLLIEATRTLRRERVVTENGSMRSVVESVKVHEQVLVPPTKLLIDGDARSERRGRGVFTSLLYHAQLDVAAQFELPPSPTIEGDLLGYQINAMRLLLGVGDSRGIGSITLEVAGEALEVEPGAAGVAWQTQGLHANLPPALWSERQVSMQIALALSGTDSLAVVPVGGETTVKLRSDWPHPGFAGEHLPSRRDISASGFEADWNISRLASRAQQALASCGANSAECYDLTQTALSVRLVDPVDRYLLTERALKYALLFLALVFGAVFFVEALRQVEVHPIQYGLTGLALAVFYLLLLALAEHIGFALAYLLSALACVAVIAPYMSAVLGDRKRGTGFATLVAALYGLLYGVLQSEDYALLTGALALFALLAGVMLATRRLNWFALGQARA
ncbi:MAG: cell envelope integrity protein CreD [Pseudomarimonas sp.]